MSVVQYWSSVVQKSPQSCFASFSLLQLLYNYIASPTPLFHFLHMFRHEKCPLFAESFAFERLGFNCPTCLALGEEHLCGSHPHIPPRVSSGYDPILSVFILFHLNILSFCHFATYTRCIFPITTCSIVFKNMTLNVFPKIGEQLQSVIKIVFLFDRCNA